MAAGLRTFLSIIAVLGAAHPALANDRSFAGHLAEGETGLLHMGARHYDPSTGRFIQTDPLGILADQPYTYAAHNPYVYWDPTGLAPQGFRDEEAFSYGRAVGTLSQINLPTESMAEMKARWYILDKVAELSKSSTLFSEAKKNLRGVEFRSFPGVGFTAGFSPETRMLAISPDHAPDVGKSGSLEALLLHELVHAGQMWGASNGLVNEWVAIHVANQMVGAEAIVADLPEADRLVLAGLTTAELSQFQYLTEEERYIRGYAGPPLRKRFQSLIPYIDVSPNVLKRLEPRARARVEAFRKNRD